MIKKKNMAVPIVVGDSWAENSADGFVEHCRKFDYFENLSDEALNDYTYYLTKDYWTFVCISDSIFI